MADFGIEAFRIEGLTGVHTAEGKVAAIGVHIKRWVTTHGFALNVNTDLNYYNWIIACEGEPVTSMSRLLDREIDVAEVEDRIAENFRDVFGYASDIVDAIDESEPGAVETGSPDLGIRNAAIAFELRDKTNPQSAIADSQSADFGRHLSSVEKEIVS